MAIVPLAARPSRVRVLFWHVSNFAEPTWWGVIVGLSPGANISGLKGEVFVGHSGNIGLRGRCIADAHLMGTMDPLTVGPDIGNNERLIWSAQAMPKSSNPDVFSLIGAVLEFDVNPEHFISIRTAITRTQGQWGLFADDVASQHNNDEAHKVHVRGFWSKADIFLQGPTLDCYLQAPPPAFVEFDVCETGGPEATFFSAGNSWAIGVPGSNPLILGSTDNRAAYGANLRYTLLLRNSAPQEPVALSLGFACISTRHRSIGEAKYFGVGQISEPPRSAYKLMPIPGSPTSLKGHHLTAPNLGGPIFVPRPGTTADLRFANACAAGTPFNVLIRRDALWPQPVEEPN